MPTRFSNRSACWLAVLWLALAAQPVQARIEAPPIDGSDYETLRTEVVSQIPAYAPEWTDHATHDPGVTLLELFAFLDENELYRMITEYEDRPYWADFDRDDERFLGQFAYVLLDAARLTSRPNVPDPPEDWLERNGVDPEWTFRELIAAARRPEASRGLMWSAGFAVLLMLAILWTERRRKRKGT